MNLLKLAIIGFLLALFGYVLPSQITSLILYSSLTGTAYAGMLGMYLAGAFFTVFTLPVILIIHILIFIFLHKYFKKNNIKNFKYFLLSYILFLFLVYPILIINLPGAVFILFDFQSLVVVPLVFIINYLIFVKLNITIKFLGQRSTLLIVWVMLAIFVIFCFKVGYSIYDRYMLFKAEKIVKQIEITGDIESFLNSFDYNSETIKIKQNRDGFKMSPIYPYEVLGYSKKYLTKSMEIDNCWVTESIRIDKKWGVFFIELEKHCDNFSNEENFYGPFRYNVD